MAVICVIFCFEGWGGQVRRSAVFLPAPPAAHPERRRQRFDPARRQVFFRVDRVWENTMRLKLIFCDPIACKLGPMVMGFEAVGFFRGAADSAVVAVFWGVPSGQPENSNAPERVLPFPVLS